MIQDIQCSSVDAHQRDHDRLERDDHRRHHQSKRYLGNNVIVSHDIICQHRCEQRHEHSCRNCHDQRILERIQEIHLGKRFYKVVKGQTFDRKQPGKRTLDNIPLLFQRVDHDHDERKHICDKNDDQPDHCQCICDFFLCSTNYSLFHYASTSCFLVRYTWRPLMHATTINRIRASACPTPNCLDVNAFSYTCIAAICVVP